jgi:hypothetical protein
MPNTSYLFYYNLVLEYFYSSIAEYQEYSVLNSSKEDDKFNPMSGSNDIYSNGSSTHKWYLTLYCCSMIPRGRVSIEKTRGPRTQPCGTIDNRNQTSDKLP